MEIMGMIIAHIKLFPIIPIYYFHIEYDIPYIILILCSPLVPYYVL